MEEVLLSAAAALTAFMADPVLSLLEEEGKKWRLLPDAMGEIRA
jgi:hypothetical protein